MVLGLHYGMAEPDDSEAFQDTFEKVGKFVEEFKARHGTLNCHQLIGLNVFSEDLEEPFLRQFLTVDGFQLLIADVIVPLLALIVGAIGVIDVPR